MSLAAIVGPIAPSDFRVGGNLPLRLLVAATPLLLPGPEGPQGPIGLTGPEGPPGPGGGEPGPAGPQGEPGIDGDDGVPGPQGEDGPQGIQGIPGSTGPQGIQGIPGPEGPQGDAGLQGIQGVPGDDGAAGAPGAEGPEGPQGDIGLTGLQGIQGVPGNDGADGAAGGQGIQGVPGIGAPVYALLANGATAMGFGTPRTVVKVTPTANATYTTTVPPAGTHCHILILTAGTTSRTITFGTGFKPVGTLATGAVSGRVFSIGWVSDGANMYETGRTAAMVA